MQDSPRKDSSKKVDCCKSCGAALSQEDVKQRGPFCSERCRLQDLSKWFGENYRIASNPVQSQREESEE